MTIQYQDGNAFEGDGQAVVVTVNCVGAMGRGIAEECRGRMWWLYKAYKGHCARRRILPGTISLPYCLYDGPQVREQSGHDFVVLLPTKDDWKKPSRIDWISSGLEDLVALAVREKWAVVDMTLPGTANGWIKDKDSVRLLVREILGPSDTLFKIWTL